MDPDLTLCTLDDTVTEMVSGLRRLATVGLCAAAACSGQTGPPMRIVLAHAATGDARCFVPGGGAQPADEPLQGVNLGGLTVATVRLSIRAHSAGDVAGNFLCDRVLSVPRDVPSLRIPRNGADAIDIYAEAFAPLATGESVPRRVAVGGL